MRIDFDEDGDFSDANSDVTSDVRQMNWTGGKNLKKQRADAAVLDLILKNDGHKYSPSSTASALYPNTLPSPEVWVTMGYPVDTFDADNATTLTDRKPDYDNNFGAWAGDTGNFNVLSNKLRTPIIGNFTAVLDFNEANCYLGCKFTRGGTASGIIARWSDASNFLLIRHDGSDISLDKVEGGSTSLIFKKSYTWNAGDEKWIFVRLHGDAVWVWVDDTLQFVQTTTFNNTADKHGVGGRSTHANDRWDDFGGWRSVFFGRIDRIVPRPEIARQYCYIRALDDMERMSSFMTFETVPTGGSVTAKQIVDQILNAVNKNSAGTILARATANRNVDTGSILTETDTHEKALERDGLTEMYQVQDDDVGFFYIDGGGVYHYEEIEHRATAPHTNNQKTWRGDRALGSEEDIYFSQDLFEWDDGKERVENEIYFKYSKIARTTNKEVWRLHFDDRPKIPAGQSLEFLAIGEGDQVGTITTPLVDTDFKVNASDDASGSDLSDYIAVSIDAHFDGNMRLIKLTNNGSVAGYVTFLRLRAIKGTRSAKVAARAENAVSQVNVGRRRIQHEALHIDRFGDLDDDSGLPTDKGSASNRANVRLLDRYRAKERVKCTMHPGTKMNLMQIVHRVVSDRVQLVYTPMGINDSYHIEGQAVKVTEGGLKIDCEWILQQAVGQPWGQGARWGQFQW